MTLEDLKRIKGMKKTNEKEDKLAPAEPRGSATDARLGGGGHSSSSTH